MEEQYKNSYKYFENRDCKYYPCHNMEHINCLFCYCPMYRIEKCLGNPKFIDYKGRTIKDCSHCTFSHDATHYEAIMDFLKNQ